MARRLLVEVLAGPAVGETYERREDTILVGRGSNCQLQVNSPHVSRQQCELSWQGDQLVLENLGTVNVTYLNDRPIERVYVQDGDLITFCDVALRVRIPRAEAAQADPDRTVAFPKDQMDAGHPLPKPGSDATVVRSGPPMQDTHPPGPLDGPRVRPPQQPVPGALGTGMYGVLSGQHAAHVAGAPPAGLPPGAPPQMMGTQKFQAQPHLAPPSTAPIGPPGGQSHGQRPHGMPASPPGMPPGMPGPPPGMPGPPRAGHGHPPPQRASAQSVERQRPRRARGTKKAATQGPNLPLIRNVVLVAAAVIVLLSFAYTLSQQPGAKRAASREIPTPAPVAVELATPAPVVRAADDPRTDEEIVREAQKLFGTGATYLREYRIADENLWTAKEYMGRARAELAIVPSERWPSFAPELEQKLAETEGLLDQEFRRLKLAYVREKSAGNYDRAGEELDRLQRIFPDKDDERHQFGRKQKKVLQKLMSGGDGGGIFGG